METIAKSGFPDEILKKTAKNKKKTAKIILDEKYNLRKEAKNELEKPHTVNTDLYPY
jgi:hypothetical protein